MISAVETPSPLFSQSQNLYRLGCHSGKVSLGFSLHNSDGYGDKGAVTTRDAALAQRVRVLGNYGSHVKYLNEIKGDNARLVDLQAACLRVPSGMGRPPLDSGLIRAAASVA